MTDLELYFQFRCFKGLKERGFNDNPIYVERLNYEIKIIKELGFASYLLVVADILAWAKSVKQPQSAGRGSAAGSLACYCLQITHIDPIKYGLVFERFLNPARKGGAGLCDIDMDFCELRRGEVIDYVRNKYGKDKVSHIGTFGTLKAKAAIRDVARALDYPYAIGDKLAKLTLEPIAGKPQPLSVCYEKVPELYNYRYGKECPEKEILEWAEKIEGRIRSFGQHACFPGKSMLMTVDGPQSFINLSKSNQPIQILTSSGIRWAKILKAGRKPIYKLRYCSSIHSRTYASIYLTKQHRIYNSDGVYREACNSLGNYIGHIYGPNKHDINSLFAGWIWNDGSWIEIQNTQYAYFTPNDDDEAKQLFDPFLRNYKYLDRPDKYGVKTKFIQTIISKFGDGFKEKLATKREPHFNSSYEKAGWLCGFISANGTIQRGEIRVKIACKKLLEKIKSSIEELGIPVSKIYHRKVKEKTFIRDIEVFFNDVWEFYISPNNSFKFLSLIGIIQTYKINKIKPQKVLYLDFVNEENTYDFSVLTEDENEQNGYVDGVLVHNSGILIGRNKISKKVPLYQGKDGSATSQFEMKTVEEVGLIKFDFLGLRALTTIDRCIRLIETRHSISINPFGIPVDDPETYKLLQSGDTVGLFQLEGSSGIRDLLIQIRPICLDDISTLVALYRPGPLGSPMLQHYLQVRAGLATPKYRIPELKPILEITDGMLIYQEQILRIAKELAGYSMGEAELLRKAVGKKIEKEMAAQYPRFISGMVDNGISKNNAKEIWDDVNAFAMYGFNRSHSICYSVITYQMAWLKTHYPLEFICSCLVSDSDETDKVIKYIAYCKEQGIEVLPPSINNSEYDFSISGKSIRFGLGAIKNLGKPVEELIREREKGGAFKGILDFAERMDLGKFNRKKLESLVLAGAFDETGNSNRMSLMGAINNILKHKAAVKSYESKLTTYNNKMLNYDIRQHELAVWAAMSKEEQKAARQEGKKRPNQIKLPVKPEKPAPPSIPDKVDLHIQERLMWEKELLGYFISGHPLDSLKESSPSSISKIKEQVDEGLIGSKAKARIIAIPSVINQITTKKTKKKMAYVVLEDKTGTIQATVLPAIYERYSGLIDTKTPALYDVEVEITENDEKKITKLIIFQVRALKSVKDFESRPVEIELSETRAIKAAKILKEMRGTDHLVILTIKTKHNIWECRYWCEGNRAEVQKALRDFV